LHFLTRIYTKHILLIMNKLNININEARIYQEIISKKYTENTCPFKKLFSLLQSKQTDKFFIVKV